jgi:hypothetical protein
MSSGKCIPPHLFSEISEHYRLHADYLRKPCGLGFVWLCVVLCESHSLPTLPYHPSLSFAYPLPSLTRIRGKDYPFSPPVAINLQLFCTRSALELFWPCSAIVFQEAIFALCVVFN